MTVWRKSTGYPLRVSFAYDAEPRRVKKRAGCVNIPWRDGTTLLKKKTVKLALPSPSLRPNPSISQTPKSSLLPTSPTTTTTTTLPSSTTIQLALSRTFTSTHRTASRHWGYPDDMSSLPSLLIAAIVANFISLISAASVSTLTNSVKAIGTRNLHEFDKASRSTIAGRVVYLSVALLAFGVLVFCFSELLDRLRAPGMTDRSLT